MPRRKQQYKRHCISCGDNPSADFSHFCLACEAEVMIQPDMTVLYDLDSMVIEERKRKQREWSSL